MVCHHHGMLRSLGAMDILTVEMILICHVIRQDHVIKR